MCKMMDKALNNVFGMENTISEIDSLVLADEEILVNHNAAKDRRAVRIEQKKKEKERNKRLYNPYDVVNWGRKAAYNSFRGVCPVFHGENEPVTFIKKSRKNETKHILNKIANRKVRYERFFENLIPDVAPIGGITLCEDEEDWIGWYSTLSLGEKIGISNKDFFTEYHKTRLEKFFELKHKVTLARLKVLDAKLDLELAKLELKNFERNNG